MLALSISGKMHSVGLADFRGLILRKHNELNPFCGVLCMKNDRKDFCKFNK